MARKNIIAAAFAGLLIGLAGTAVGFSELHFSAGTVDSYDFGAFGPGQPVPGTVVIEGFTIGPGESVGWHYHKGQSYVIVVRGTVTEEELMAQDQCITREDTAGSAFVEAPGQIHNVTNHGRHVAVIWWATIFPQSDGIDSDGTYFVDTPNCQ